ncbi:MAG: T9SS type A sorting domain-containing protein, partial [Ignavibacteria bacterium]|nr:T9SS type A sorting domain-containing protein [Ignavibacteria bacterium]
LIVKLSTDGGVTFPYEIFRKGGSGLATAPSTTSSFVPTPNQWQTFAYPLTDINVPVELTSFVASVVAKNVELTWTTATEINNMGFEIEKSFDGNNFIKIGFVEGRGTSSEAHNYLFTDKPDLQQKTKFNYRLRQVDFDGKAKYSIIVNVFYDVPDNFALNQNYPNPFNPTTTINYSIAETAPVTLKIYDVTGREVSVLVDEVKQPGRYEITFDASSLASGVYFYKLNAGSFSSVKKLSVLK